MGVREIKDRGYLDSTPGRALMAADTDQGPARERDRRMTQPSAPRSRKPARLTAAKTRLAAEIRDQLRAQGGAAHRDVIIARILARKGVRGPAADRTRRALLSAFELHAHPEPDSPAPHLFDLPFGPESYRWALDERAGRRSQADGDHRD